MQPRGKTNPGLVCLPTPCRRIADDDDGDDKVTVCDVANPAHAALGDDLKKSRRMAGEMARFRKDQWRVGANGSEIRAMPSGPHRALSPPTIVAFPREREAARACGTGTGTSGI